MKKQFQGKVIQRERVKRQLQADNDLFYPFNSEGMNAIEQSGNQLSNMLM